MAEVDRLGWAVTVPLRSGAHVLGARVNSEALGELVRELFASRVTEPAEPPGNLSLYLASPAEPGGIQELHQLYDTHSLQLRTRDAVRSLEALWHELDRRDARWSATRRLINATVVVRGGRAHLLPASRRSAIVRDLRRWEADGNRLVDARWVQLDIDVGCVVVREPTFDVPPARVREGIAALAPAHRRGPKSVTGRLPIASWTLSQSEPSPGQRLLFAAAQVLDRVEHLNGASLRQLSAILDEVADLGWALADDESLRAALQDTDASITV